MFHETERVYQWTGKLAGSHEDLPGTQLHLPSVLLNQSAVE
jgi:hypothetical protein